MTTTTPTRSGTATTTAAPGRVVAYNRISRFREAVGATSVEVTRATDRQEMDANRYAAEAGWSAVDEHYTDTGRSASEYRTKARERFADLLDAVATGQVAVILVWVLDRIVRDPRDLETLMDLCRLHGVRIIQTASGSELDPNNPESILHARISGAVAAYEAAKTSMRQRRRMEAAVAAGAPHGGRRRFGYEPGMAEIREAEASVIRELVTRFLAGESLRSLAKWLTDNGVDTPGAEDRRAKGKAPAVWTGPNLRGMLAGPHLAGLRVHKGAVVGPGSWPAILDMATHEDVVATLNNPDRRPAGAGNARRWLLSGLATCAECGTPVRARPAHTTRKGHTIPPSYYCPTGRHVHRRADYVDREVELAVVGRLARYDASGLLADNTDEAEVIRLRDARAALDERYAAYVAEADTMTPKAYAAATARLEATMAALDVQIAEARATAHTASRVLAEAAGPEAAARWFGKGDRAGWDLSRKRAIIAELCTVELVGGRTNTTPTGTRFNPSDVDVKFRRG
jgi:DNA invertase Pin-like site-specific DNA recombinase